MRVNLETYINLAAMKNIFVLSFNNLGLDFWKKHLEIQNVERIYQFTSAETCLKSLNCEPDLVIVDDYFSNTKEGDPDAIVVLEAIHTMLPNTICLHISPTHCYNAKFDPNTNTYCSNFNQDILNKMNLVLNNELMEKQSTPTS